MELEKMVKLVGLTDKNEAMFIMFSAPWCSPCKVVKPVFKELADKYSDKAGFQIMDVESEGSNELLELFEIRSVPTIVYVTPGVYDILEGQYTPVNIESFIKSHI